MGRAGPGSIGAGRQNGAENDVPKARALGDATTVPKSTAPIPLLLRRHQNGVEVEGPRHPSKRPRVGDAKTVPKSIAPKPAHTTGEANTRSPPETPNGIEIDGPSGRP